MIFQVLLLVLSGLFILLNLLIAALSGFDTKNTECEQQYWSIGVCIILLVLLYYCGAFDKIF
jgi:hypothetical protein